MSGLGSYAVSGTHGGDHRFYNPPPVRKQQQQLLLQQQKNNINNNNNNCNNNNNNNNCNNNNICSNDGNLDPDNRIEGSNSEITKLEASNSENTKLLNFTNLDRFIESVTPSVTAHFSSEANKRSWKGREPELQLYYGLGDLWDSFGEWSVYGVGVPLVLNGEESIVQYYVPFLSGLQLYVDPVKTPLRGSDEENNVVSSRETSSGGSSDCEADKRSGTQQANSNSLRKSGLPTREKSQLSLSSEEAESTNYSGKLVFEYMERESPHNRKPLADKISALASEYPDLRKYKSSDLLPSSWISVAWYPIYRIPVGSSLKDLDASFLTFHSLSTNSSNNGQLRSHGAGGRKAVGVDVALKVPLPVFGLASYKLKGSILSPSGPLECQQENTLLEAADCWLRNLQAIHPDYQFFLHHYSYWR